MSLIPALISPQAFEIIRDQLGLILKVEFHAQSVLNSSNKDIDPAVWIERFIPFKQTDMPALNIMLASGSLGEQTVRQTNGTYTFFIDIHTKAKSTTTEDGDVKAVFKLHRLLGIARAILEDTRYKTLGFTTPFIISRHVTDIQINQPSPDGEGANVVMGRLTLVVRAPEVVVLPGAVQLIDNKTTIKMSETEKGYFYELTNA